MQSFSRATNQAPKQSATHLQPALMPRCVGKRCSFEKRPEWALYLCDFVTNYGCVCSFAAPTYKSFASAPFRVVLSHQCAKASRKGGSVTNTKPIGHERFQGRVSVAKRKATCNPHKYKGPRGSLRFYTSLGSLDRAPNPRPTLTSATSGSQSPGVDEAKRSQPAAEGPLNFSDPTLRRRLSLALQKRIALGPAVLTHTRVQARGWVTM